MSSLLARPRQLWLRIGLHMQVALVASLLTALGVLVSGVVQMERAEALIHSNIVKQQNSLTVQVVDSLERRMDVLRLTIEAIARDGLTEHEMRHPDAAERVLARHRVTVGQLFDHLFLFSPDKQILADNPRIQGRQGLFLPHHTYIQQSWDEHRTIISNPFIGDASRIPQIGIVTPVTDRSGRLQGFVMGTINLKGHTLFGALQDFRIGNTGYIYLLHPQTRQLIYHADPRRILEVIPPGKNTAIDKVISTGFEGTEIGENSRGLTGFFSFRRMNSTGWYVAAVFPVAEAYAGLRNEQAQQLLWVSGLAVLSGLLAGLVMARLLRPIHHLREQVIERTRQFAPNTPIDAQLPHELAQVADSINQLLETQQRLLQEQASQQDALRRHRDELETEIQAQTQHLIAARESAEEANRAKTEFLTNITHELRTPMHAILSFSNLGISKITAGEHPKLLRYFTNIRNAGERMMLLINDLLDLSKLEIGAFDMRMELLDLREIVRQVDNEMFAFAREREVRLRLDLPPSACLIRGDTQRLMQVGRNLLSNAVKFSPANAAVEVRIGSEEHAGKMLLIWDVIDQGIGIPEGELESVFHKFVQSSLTKDGSGGTGLGLPICREIIERHGGTIVAFNNPEQGCTLRIELPQASHGQDGPSH